MENTARRVYDAYPEVEDAAPQWSGAKSHQFNNAIDLIHLSHQSLGDRALERELLVLFDRHASQIVNRLRATVSSKAPEMGEATDLAHTLKGSALAVGARRVAKAAEALEMALKLPLGEDPLNARIAEIDAAVGEAGQAVAGMLASM